MKTLVESRQYFNHFIFTHFFSVDVYDCYYFIVVVQAAYWWIVDQLLQISFWLRTKWKWKLMAFTKKFLTRIVSKSSSVHIFSLEENQFSECQYSSTKWYLLTIISYKRKYSEGLWNCYDVLLQLFNYLFTFTCLQAECAPLHHFKVTHGRLWILYGFILEITYSLDRYS